MSSNLEIHLVEKSSLFFNQYRYSIRFNLSELGVIRGLKSEHIDKIVRERNRFRSEHRGFYRGSNQLITDEDVVRLKKVCRLLCQHQDELKLSISYHTGYVYTNNFKLAEKISELNFIGYFRVQQAVQVCPAGTIALKNPKWTHRTYFKSRQLNDQQREQLIDYLQSRENIRLSPGLKSWMEQNNNVYWNTYTQDYYFFDHNNDGEVLFLNMVSARITGRTLQIVAK